MPDLKLNDALLSQLLQTNGGPSTSGSGSNDNIVVNGQSPNVSPAEFSTPTPTPSGLDLSHYFDNSDYIKALDDQSKKTQKHRSLLRQIVGTLGDAFLMQAGQKPLYQEGVDKEKLGRDMAGFTDSPLAAIERMARDNPSAAAELYKQYQTNQYQNGQLKSLDNNRQSEIDNRTFDNRDKGMTRVQQWAYGGMPYNQIVAAAKSYGIDEADLQEMGITPEMTPEDRQHFAYGGMSVNQQVQVPFTERRTASGEVNAAAHMKNASRPPRPAQPRATTNIHTYVGEDGYEYTDRSDGTTVKSGTKVRQTKGGNGRRSISPAPSSGWGSVTRN